MTTLPPSLTNQKAPAEVRRGLHYKSRGGVPQPWDSRFASTGRGQSPPIPCCLIFGAGNETRTRDPDLGKVVLYQLSYSRI